MACDEDRREERTVKDIFHDLMRADPTLAERHGIDVSRCARETLIACNRVLYEQVIGDRPLHPDDMPPKGGSLPASLRDDEDEPNADIFDCDEEE